MIYSTDMALFTKLCMDTLIYIITICNTFKTYINTTHKIVNNGINVNIFATYVIKKKVIYEVGQFMLKYTFHIINVSI